MDLKNKKTFTVICNICGEKITIQNEDKLYMNESISIYGTIYEEIIFECKNCGSTISI